MSVSLRRRRKLRQQEILDAACDVLLNDGYGAFSMETVAEAMGCSRSAVYKQFSCKEEIVLAMALETERLQQKLRERALLFSGRPRERLMAIGATSAILFPRQLVAKLLATSPAVRQARTPQDQREELRLLIMRGVCSDMGIVREAVVCGDLVPPEGMDYRGVFFGLWSAQWGAMSFMSSDIPLRQMGFENPESDILGSLLAMMDGFGWRPLSTEWDYTKTLRRIAAEAFPPDVVAEVNGRPLETESLPRMLTHAPRMRFVGATGEVA